MTRLNQTELRLLRHPPTEKTWICKCTYVNSGGQRKCVSCGKAKPSRPKLLWPAYLAACKKADREPDGKSYNPNGVVHAETPPSPRKPRGRKRGQ